MSESRAYHHGNLREALIGAAVDVIREEGADALTLREAARRAGVSSGAPFRHFPNRTALMTAVAEEGMQRLRAAVEAGLAACRSDHPLARLLAIGEAYLDWVIANPTHYKVCGDRKALDWAGSEVLPRDNRWIREQMLVLLDQARARKMLRETDIGAVNLQTRALAYGLARMHVDGHLPEFDIAEGRARGAMRGVLESFLLGLVRDPEAAREALKGR